MQRVFNFAHYFEQPKQLIVRISQLKHPPRNMGVSSEKQLPLDAKQLKFFCWNLFQFLKLLF